ncbi:MAG: hypothetical protein N2645_16860 [Clostridia bacterium]|nr:hypothetical protein [Clostridia bacterium]
MIDIHCHVLPGLDDGASSFEIALNMCKAACEKGVKKIIATPHFISDSSFKSSPEKIIEVIGELKRKLAEVELDIDILPGMEIFLNDSLPDMLEKGEVLTLNNSRYVLVELPLNDIPLYTEDILYQLQIKGYTPVLAHPERNSIINRDLRILKNYINKGILVQVNSGSLKGRYGSVVKACATEIVKRNMVSFVASDAHGVKGRYSGFEQVEWILKGITGREKADEILKVNSLKLANNEDIESPKMNDKDDFSYDPGTVNRPKGFKGVKRFIRKKAKTIIITSVILLFLGGVGTFFTVRYMVNTAFNKVFESILVSEGFEIVYDDEDNTEGIDTTADKQQNGIPDKNKPINNNINLPDNNSGGSSIIKDNPSSAGDSIAPQKGENIKKTRKISAKKIKEIEEKISFEDKTSALSIVNDSLTSEQIDEITDMLSGGITAEEEEKIKAMLKKSLSKDQKGEVKGLYNKYDDLLEE